MHCFMQLCRLCASDENVSFTLHNPDSDGKCFIDKLEAIVPEIVDCNIKLPNGICTICAIQLNEAYKFIKQCLDTQIILKQRQLNEQLCRLCASNENISLTLNSMDSDNILISYKLETIASEIMEYNEKLSDCVCSICSVRLNETYKCIEKFFESQEILKRYAKQPMQNSEIMKIEIKNEIVEGDSSCSNKIENNTNFESVYIKEENIDEAYIKQDVEIDIKVEESLELENNINFETVFITEETINEEATVHANEKCFVCQICNKTFNKNKYLKKHYIRHTNTKPHKCVICERTFAERGDLKKHIRSHTQERPFKCTTCERAFAQSGDLKIHIRSHTQERPYPCELCKKAFARSQHLKRHMRSHTQERPYKCDICENAFTMSQHLKRHIRSKHTNK